MKKKLIEKLRKQLLGKFSYVEGLECLMDCTIVEIKRISLELLKESIDSTDLTTYNEKDRVIIEIDITNGGIHLEMTKYDRWIYLYGDKHKKYIDKKFKEMENGK